MAKNVLLAAHRKLISPAQRARFAPGLTFTAYSTLDTAVAALEQQDFDLIVCGVHFDNGKLYDFLKAAKSHPNSSSVPFVVVDSGAIPHYPSLHQSVEIACGVLGAAAVLPLTKWRQDLGDDAAFEKYFQALRRMLAD
jgi:CheY-like chemotaxis protein